jgi:hypothetical protein
MLNLLKRKSVPVFVLIAASSLFAQPPKHTQPKEVVEAYRVCRQFQQLMAENLDFDRAFEATFTKNAARRREIAITEGEFGNVDLSSVDEATLVSAFKARMQILYLMLPLASPDDKAEEELFFPPAIKTIFERKPPTVTADFRAYAMQLKEDANRFRAHLDQLASRYPHVAERVRKFKSDLAREIKEPDHVVKPLTAYSRGRVLALNEKYYQIGDYAVIREGKTMRIIGIRFFSRLF